MIVTYTETWNIAFKKTERKIDSTVYSHFTQKIYLRSKNKI